MTNHDFVTLSVADGTSMDAYVAIPGDGVYPGILVFQEAFGVNGHIRNIAERLCKEGYAAIAPDLFHRSGQRIEVSYTDFGTAMPLLQATTPDGLKADITACYQWLQSSQQVNKDKIGSIGFCFGGRVSYLANITVPLAAGVSYYGGGLDQLAGEVSQQHGAHLFYWGGQDKHIPQEKIDTIINAIKEAGKEYTNVVISYADHAFNCDERPSYQPQAASEAWAHTLSFLANRLK